MNIENIRAFLEISQTGSFQQAARNLHITQSAMSARIKGLENSLNRQLFLRRRNGALLTPGGQSFLRHAASLIRTWELARQESALADEFESVVGLGVQLNHWQAIVTPWVKWMSENHPTLATHIQSDYSSRLMELLRTATIDVAILYEPQQIPGIIIEPFADEPLIMISSVPRSVEQGSVEGYVYVDWGQKFRADHSRVFPGIGKHRLSVGLADVGLGHIEMHGGSGYFLQSAVKQQLAEGTLHRVENAPEFTITTFMAYIHAPERQDIINHAIAGLRSIALET